MRVLPLNDAYPFGIEHGLESEISAIRGMEIEWDSSYTSSLRRGYIVDLFQKHGLLDEFKERFWAEGNTPSGETMVRRYSRIKSQYEDFLSGNADESFDVDQTENEIEQDQEFAAETDLRDFLAKNLHLIEPGLRLCQGDGGNGIEFGIDNGRIDILAVDQSGRYVVFELKVSRGRNRTLGQILYYMAWVDQHLGHGPCRGVIIAREISEDLLLATQRVQGVSLYKYKMSFTVEKQ